MEKVIDKVKFKIDGLEVMAEPGTNVLDAALENDIYIPHLCHHPDLVPAGVCRLCGVEVNGRVTMSCLTPVQEGMEVKTENPEIDKARRVALKLLLTNHELVCHTCSANNDCELQRVVSYVGITEADMGQMRRTRGELPIDSSNPFFEFDPNKCVLCGICVRTCDEIQGVFAIDFVNRGYNGLRILWRVRGTLPSRCADPQAGTAPGARGQDDLRVLWRGLWYLPGYTRRSGSQRARRSREPNQ